MADEDQAPEGGTGAGEGAEGERMDLPKWNRARVKRKAPAGEEQDAFQGSVRRAGRGAARRAPLILGGIVVVGLGIGGVVWGMTAMQEGASDRTKILAEAAALEARAQVVPDKAAILGDTDRPPPVPIVESEEEKATLVSEALARLGEKDGGPELAARLMTGARAIRTGDFDGAEAAYRSFLDAAGKRHELAFLAGEGLGIALEGKGDLEGALEQYKQATGEKGSFYRDQLLAHTGRVLEALDRKDEALEVYRTYVEEFPLSGPSLALEHVRDRMTDLDPDAVPTAPEGSLTNPGIVPPPPGGAE